MTDLTVAITSILQLSCVAVELKLGALQADVSLPSCLDL